MNRFKLVFAQIMILEMVVQLAGKHASPIHSRASLNLIVEPGLYMLLRFQKSYARKLRVRKPGLFNALEIFDHTA
jgi:hypothetical protein